jgi:carboxyl-terminal processing protease
VVLFALLVLGATPAESPQEQGFSPEPYFSDIAREFSRQMPRKHIGTVPIDDAMSERSLARFLSSLDSDHSFFLASDVEEFRQKYAKNLDDMIKRGDVSFAYEAVRLFRQRAHERYEFAEKLLDKGLDLAVDETYMWKRNKDTPWPATAKEQDEIWRKKIKDQYIQKLLANERLAASAENTGTEDDSTPAPEITTPEEFVLKRLRQFMTILDDADSEWVFQRYMSALANGFDPHSDYMSPRTVEDFDIGMKLSLTGIGALLSTGEDGSAKVERILPGGPAEKDGRLQPGDRIIAVGQEDEKPVEIVHWPLSKSVRLIRGDKGKKVILWVVRGTDVGGATTVKIDLIRDKIRLEDQEAKGSIRTLARQDGTTNLLGVISLPGFYVDMTAQRSGKTKYKSSAHDVEKLLRDMRRQAVQGMVLDLRNNGGGSLLEVIDMTGLFITKGPVVQVKDKTAEPGQASSVFRDDDESISYEGPVVVLVNRMSASASEILAAALQDYGRAVVVGDQTTHGKGTVQSVENLSEGKKKWGALKVTTAGFYRFTGGSVQVEGVSSDIVLPSVLDVMELGENSLDGRLPPSRIAPASIIPPAHAGLLGGLFGFFPAPSDDGPFQQVVDLEDAILILKEKSEKRRAVDPRFIARERWIARFAERQNRDTISLNLEERRKKAEEDRELADLQKELITVTDADDDSPDIILEEAMAILSDLIAIRNAAETGKVASSGQPAEKEPAAK